jgi:hypothetical protein
MLRHSNVRIAHRASAIHSHVRVTLPKFALLVLRRRAKQQRKTLSAVLEALIWDAVWLDEVQAVTRESPEAAGAFKAWFAFAVRKRKDAGPEPKRVSRGRSVAPSQRPRPRSGRKEP